MTTTTSGDIGTLISKRPDFYEGEACIAGTGLRLRRIVIWYQLGYTPPEIAAKYPHISLAQVHAALAYYYANRQEIDAEIEDEEKLYKELSERAKATRT